MVQGRSVPRAGSSLSQRLKTPTARLPLANVNVVSQLETGQTLTALVLRRSLQTAGGETWQWN